MLKRLLSGFKAVSTALGNVMGRVILSVFYFVLLPPFVLWSHLRADPLRLKSSAPAVWQSRPRESEATASARQQY